MDLVATLVGNDTSTEFAEQVYDAHKKLEAAAAHKKPPGKAQQALHHKGDGDMSIRSRVQCCGRHIYPMFHLCPIQRLAFL